MNWQRDEAAHRKIYGSPEEERERLEEIRKSTHILLHGSDRERQEERKRRKEALKEALRTTFRPADEIIQESERKKRDR
jgi:hypothetical protein